MIDKPITVYKYHRANEYLMMLLTKKKLWFSHYCNLNDFFECKFGFSNELHENSIKNAAITTYNELNNTLHPNGMGIEEYIEKAIKDRMISPTYKNDFVNKFKNGLNFSVCCFTTNPLNELMWGHYGDGHRGICLEFNLINTPYLYKNLHPVQYQDDLPLFNTIKDIIPGAALYKRPVWAYEEEWRLVYTENGEMPFNSESLTGVIFGARVSEDTKENIARCISDGKYLNVDYYQADVLNNKIEKIKINIF